MPNASTLAPAGLVDDALAGVEPQTASGREVFATDELAIVLSHYDIGPIESVTEFARGSRKSPKALVTAEQGRFILKKRARGRDDPYRVAFAHALQLHLATRRFPLPHLIGTRKENNSMFQWRSGVYELFEYIPGQGYPQTLETTSDAGRVLATYHRLTESFHTQWKSAVGSYHDAPAVHSALQQIASNVTASYQPLVASIKELYVDAAHRVEALGISRWPVQIAHADWHPGNMLFRDNHIVAVIDYDSARYLPRISDIANGALQFSILGGSGEVGTWPEHTDEVRFTRFLAGYDSQSVLSRHEIEAIPWLMIEALIAEAAFPIAATGSFGRLEGLTFLEMVHRKTSWFKAHANALSQLALAQLPKRADS